jgi:hypothetical protein
LVFDASGAVSQAGVLSYGEGADLPDWRDVKTSRFTRTDVFRDWILQGVSDLENDVWPRSEGILTGGKFALNFNSTTRNSLDIRLFSSTFLSFADSRIGTLEVYVGGEYYDGCSGALVGNGKFYGDYGGVFSVSTRKGEIRYSIKGSSASDLPEYLGPLGIDRTPGYFPVPVPIRIGAPRFEEYVAQGTFSYRVSRSGGRGKY